MRAYLLAFVFILSIFITQNSYCVELGLYIYIIDSPGNEKVLLKIQSSDKECWQYTFKEDIYRQGNITRKIYKPYENLDKWKNGWLIDLSKLILENQLNENIDPQQLDYVLYFRLIKSLQEKVKSGYSAQLPFNAKVYIVNKMIESQPDDILTKHLTAFGYGFEFTEPNEIKKLLEKEDSSVILPQPFRKSFYTSMKSYYEKIPKTINWKLYLYFIPILLVFIILIASGFYIRAISEKANRNSQLLKKRLSDLNIQLKTENEKITRQYKSDLFDKERECLKSISKVLEDLWLSLSNRILSAELGLPINKIKELVESISNKTNGRWAEIVRKKLNEILQDNTITVESDTYINIPDSIDEFGKINWHEKYNSMLDRLVKALTSPDDSHKKVAESIARDVVTVIVNAIDGEKNIHGNVDSSVENDLKNLMEIVGIKEIEVMPGQVYNPQIHELIIDNSRSMTTDRQQKITKVISRGLILPDGKIVKAKVSIQR